MVDGGGRGEGERMEKKFVYKDGVTYLCVDLGDFMTQGSQ